MTILWKCIINFNKFKRKKWKYHLTSSARLNEQNHDLFSIPFLRPWRSTPCCLKESKVGIVALGAGAVTTSSQITRQTGEESCHSILWVHSESCAKNDTLISHHSWLLMITLVPSSTLLKAKKKRNWFGSIDSTQSFRIVL